MSAPKSQTQDRAPSPSPTGLLRRCRHNDSEAGLSPWRRRNPARRAGDGWAGSNRPTGVSPFERSGRTITTLHRTYRRVVPAEDVHRTDGSDRGCENDDDDWMCDDDELGDEDEGDLTLEEVRGSSWLRDFLPWMRQLKPEEINDLATATLCPACKGGPGVSHRYRGFQGLLDHARTVRAKRVRLHRRFAEILEEELRNRRERSEGSESSDQATARSEKWQGLGGGAAGLAGDRMILWPPMVVVLNTQLGKQEGSDKWVGMGNPDLIDCFKGYEPVKARSAYGSHGHCGVSLLIFDTSVLGYHQAERLHNHFIREGRGKHEWYKQKPWKKTSDQTRLLYGYMATKEEELNIFSTHSGDKQKLKYEMKPYQMVVGHPLKEMCGSIEKKTLLEIEIAKEVERKKDLEGKLRQRELEIEATMRRLTEQSDEHNKEIESLNEYSEILRSKLRESELLLEKMQEKGSSSLYVSEDDQGEAGSTEFASHMNKDGHDRPDNEMDEIAEEKQYLETYTDPGDKKKKRPLL